MTLTNRTLPAIGDSLRSRCPLGVGRRFRRAALKTFVASVLGVVLLPAVPVGGATLPPLATHPWSPTELVVKPRDLGRISRYLFGANLLWADDAEGAFDRATGTFYPGFVSTVRRLGITVLRYPGGTTSDSFDWRRAIGPRQDRKPNEPYGMQDARLSHICCVLDGPEPSTVGPDEFGHLLDETGTAGTITVNFATGTATEAADFVAYMTAPESKRPSSNPAEPSYWAALRAKNGHPAPYDVPYWEVGNEQVFPGQYGWRSGRVVSVGPHTTRCPTGQVATCLYAFGGTTEFTGQAVGTFADELPSASYSTGAPHQTFYVYFPPVVPHRATVYVAGRPWSEVVNLSSARPQARVYALSPATGAIRFGNGAHGEVPPDGAKITASYESGPHGGFVEFYRAMRAMNPRVVICESEETDVAFLQVMGDRYPYDCVELHEYARPADFLAPLDEYELALLAFPVREGAALAALQGEIHRYSGKDVPVVITEYGQLVAPVPAADPQFNLSLDEGLLIGAELVEWIDHGVRVAEKYLVDSSPFLPTGIARATSLKERTLKPVLSIDKAVVGTGLSADSAMVAHHGREFVAEPTGEVLGLMARLAGTELLPVSTVDGPLMSALKHKVPRLWTTAAVSRRGCLYLVGINADPTAAVPVEVVLDGFRHSSWLRAYMLDGPGATAYNTASHPQEVTTTTKTAEVGSGDFAWTFPAHSVSLLQLPLATGHLVKRSGHRA